MHLRPGNPVAIGHAVVYYGRAANPSSAGTKCQYCTRTQQDGQPSSGHLGIDMSTRPWPHS